MQNKKDSRITLGNWLKNANLQFDDFLLTKAKFKFNMHTRQISFQMTAIWNEMVMLRHFDIICNALLQHKSRKEKNSFFKCHNRLQIHLFSFEYFSLFSPYFHFSHLSMVVLHKVDGRAFLYCCNSFAM